MTAWLWEFRLPAFKNVRDAVIPIQQGLTLLVGRNGSGKSNILDGLAVQTALASGATIRDALDGGRDGPLVRGGSEGCAPVGRDTFEFGWSAIVDGYLYHLDVMVSVRPNVQIFSERLWITRRSGPRYGQPQELLKTSAPPSDSGDIVAQWDNGKPGPNPAVIFRASQLLTAQVATRVPATPEADHVRRIAEGMLSALSTVFILDPVPQQMREYVPEKDVRLRRNAENLSAVLANLLEDEDTRSVLLDMTRSLSEAQVSEMNTVSSELGDVMVTIREKVGSTVRPMPARLMSDGTLRFLAIAAALLNLSQSVGGAVDSAVGGRLLVVEEIENGLHPSQAAMLLNRLRASARTGVRTLATTHSPAILDALEGNDHKSVVVCNRGPDGWSKATKLTDFPDYFEVVGRGPLGTAAVRDRLRPSGDPSEAPRSLVDVLGLQ